MFELRLSRTKVTPTQHLNHKTPADQLIHQFTVTNEEVPYLHKYDLIGPH